MNNQVKLIDSQKVKSWFLDMFDDWHPGSAPSLFFHQLEKGDFDPDTPIIKPGDRVEHKRYGTGQLIYISDNRNYGLLQSDEGQTVNVFISDLEVVK